MMDPITRARTGCWTCRTRRVKCDETHPVCRRCARINTSCGYGIRLTWHEESIARGVCHGRSAVWSKRDSPSRKKSTNSRKGDALDHARESSASAARAWTFLNTSVTDLEIYFNLRDEGQIEDLRSKAPPPPSLSTFPLSESRPTHDPALMSYFERIICSSSTLVDNAHCNPYRYLILPMALSSDGLYHATLAIAANTLRLSNPSYRIPALEHHHHALGYLRGLLDQDKWTDRELDEMTGLVLMLCWFEISDNSCSSWVAHLKGSQDLLRARQQRLATRSQPESAHSEQLSNFINRYFAFHLVLARTAFRLDDSVFDLQPMLRLMHDGNIPKENGADIIDPYMGLSHLLLLLINQVAQIAWEDSNIDDGNVDDNINVLHLKGRLENLQQIPPPLGDDADADTECVAIAEANRLGALLLLYEVCSPAMQYTASEDMEKKKGWASRSLPILDLSGKDHCVRRILHLILERKASMMRTAVLPLWPLFLAGCCAPTDAERVTVMQLFEELEGIRRFGNIAPAMEVVQMVWRQRDLAAQDERRKGSGGGRGQARFEWERAMAMLGDWKLSLT